MISKKDALTLGVLAIGGIGVASMIAGSGSGSDGGRGREKPGGILGSQQGYGAPAVYNFPSQGAVTFPSPPKFDIKGFLTPQIPVTRGEVGVSSAPKKSQVVPYLHTGGEVKPGAVSLAPWSSAPIPPKPYAYVSGEVKPGAVSVAPWAMVKPVVRKAPGGANKAKKTPTPASSAVSHAKRLRAGRGD